MTDADRLMRGIEADMDSDAPRLVLADFLEEHGEPKRAEFIRLQCEQWVLAQSGRKPARWAAVKRRADALLRANRARWTAGLPAWTRDLLFSRGFLDLYSLTGRRLAADGAALRRLAPVGGYLHLHEVAGRAAEVFASPHLEYVTELSLDGSRLTDAGVAALAAAPPLVRLRGLYLSRGGTGFPGDRDVNRLTDAAAESLAAADNLPALAELRLGDHRRLTAAGVRAIVESPKRAGLTGLDVSVGPGDPTFADVFRSRLRPAGLRWLFVRGRDLDDDGAAIILDSPHLRELRWVRFDGNRRITDATARRVLADGRAWEQVDLDGTGVSVRLRREVASRCRRGR